MNYLRVCLLLCVIASIGLYAGSPPTVIAKGSDLQKTSSLSVAHQESPKNKGKVLITVTLKGDMEVFINDPEANKGVKVVIIDGMASVSFEIDKKRLEETSLTLSEHGDLSRCPDLLMINLKEYID